MTWSIGPSSPAKKVSRAAGSLASNDLVLRAPTSVAACASRSGLRPVRMTPAPSARARRAVSRPMPALPPMTTMVCPSSSGWRAMGWATVAVVIGSLLSSAWHGWSCANGLAGRRDVLAECLQPGDVDLRERGERLDRVAEDVERDVRADRQRGLLEPLTGLGPERVGTGQPLAVAEECQEAVALGVRARVGGGLRHLRQRHHGAEAAGPGAHRRCLWVRVGHAWHGLVVGLARLTQDVRGHHVALVLADVSQRPQAGDVADRPQAVRGAQVGVDRNTVGVGLDADGVQAEPPNPRATARGDEQPVTAQLTPVVELQDVVLAVVPRARRVRRQHELDALAAENLTESLTEPRRLPGQHALGHAHHRD